MDHKPPKWLVEAIKAGKRGYQAALARQSQIEPDRLSKVLTGKRALKLDEAERLKEAIEMVRTDGDGREAASILPPAEGSGVVTRVFANTHARGRPPELVFLLNDGGHFVFQLNAQALSELRSALEKLDS